MVRILHLTKMPLQAVFAIARHTSADGEFLTQYIPVGAPCISDGFSFFIAVQIGQYDHIVRLCIIEICERVIRSFNGIENNLKLDFHRQHLIFFKHTYILSLPQLAF